MAAPMLSLAKANLGTALAGTVTSTIAGGFFMFAVFVAVGFASAGAEGPDPADPPSAAAAGETRCLCSPPIPRRSSNLMFVGMVDPESLERLASEAGEAASLHVARSASDVEGVHEMVEFMNQTRRLVGLPDLLLLDLRTSP